MNRSFVVALLVCAGLMAGAISLPAQQATAPPAAAAKPADPQAKPADAQAKPAADAAATAAAQNAAIQKAYTDATRMKDPEAKIAALDKVAASVGPAQFSIALMARANALDTLCKSFPDRKDQIRAEAEAILKVRSTAAIYLLVAKTLLGRNVLLDYAEELSRKALTIFEEETAAGTAADRARYKSALGLVYLKTGKVSEGEALLKDVAVLDAMPPYDAPSGMGKMIDDALAGWTKAQRQAALNLALADAAEKKGDLKTAADALADASMLAPMKGAERKRLEDLYRKSHNGSLDGLEESLDAKYRKMNPLAFKVEPYKADPGRTSRTVLAEMFTGSACGPCVGADLGFDALLQRYSRQEFALLVYHQHIPGPDPMTNPSGIARAKGAGVNSTPSYFINGGDKQTGGGDRGAAKGFFTNLAATIDKQLTTAAGANLALKATMTGNTIAVAVTADPLTSASPDLRVQIALVENELSYTGENGVRFHPMVVRQLAGEGYKGFALPAGKPLTIEHTFDVAAVSADIQKYIDNFIKNPPDAWVGEDISFSKPMSTLNPAHLSVVAFVEDVKAKQVLQAAFVPLKPAAAAPAPKKEQ